MARARPRLFILRPDPLAAGVLLLIPIAGPQKSQPLFEENEAYRLNRLARLPGDNLIQLASVEILLLNCLLLCGAKRFERHHITTVSFTNKLCIFKFANRRIIGPHFMKDGGFIRKTTGIGCENVEQHDRLAALKCVERAGLAGSGG